MDKKVSELESSDEGQVTSSGQALKDIDDQISHDLAEEISVAANVATNNDLQIEVDTSLEKDPASVEIEVIEKSPAIQEVVPEIDYQAEIDKLLVLRQSLADEAVLLSEQIKKQEDSTDALHRWVSEQKGSFLWKVLNRMSNNKSEVQDRLNGYQDFIDKLDIPKPGALAEIRKRFHRSLLFNWSLVLALGSLFFYLPEISENYPEFTELSRIVNSESFPNKWQIIFISLFLLLFTSISLLIQYYRDWSKFERSVTISLWKLEEISKSVQHYRTEQARLNVLYPQVRDWLEILGNALHKPWEVDEKWLVNTLSDIPQDDFPFALRIAQAQDNDAASSIKLRRDAAERYLTRGWRSKVFEDQVMSAGEMMGMSSDRLNVEILDADIALSPGGPRAVLREKITSSELLKSVAKKQLIPLMKIVQIESIAESRPPVRENRTDILDTFQPEDFDLEMNKKLAWDDFLAISMGNSDKPRTPLSQLAFSESGRQTGHHDRAKTIFITPNRLISKVPNNETTFADSYGESTRLPLDIVVRMDITGPLQQEDILILKRSDEEKEIARSSYEKTIRDKVQDYKRGV
jgi:hypothetical protein